MCKFHWLPVSFYKQFKKLVIIIKPYMAQGQYIMSISILSTTCISHSFNKMLCPKFFIFHYKFQQQFAPFGNYMFIICTWCNFKFYLCCLILNILLLSILNLFLSCAYENHWKLNPFVTNCSLGFILFFPVLVLMTLKSLIVSPYLLFPSYKMFLMLRWFLTFPLTFIVP